jgi:hypothetical protein
VVHTAVIRSFFVVLCPEEKIQNASHGVVGKARIRMLRQVGRALSVAFAAHGPAQNVHTDVVRQPAHMSFSTRTLSLASMACITAARSVLASERIRCLRRARARFLRPCAAAMGACQPAPCKLAAPEPLAPARQPRTPANAAVRTCAAQEVEHRVVQPRLHRARLAHVQAVPARRRLWRRR